MLWISILLIATTAKMLTPHTVPNVGSLVDADWFLIYGLAIICAAVHFLKQPVVVLQKAWLLAAAVLTLTACFLPSAYRIPVVLTAFAVFVLCILKTRGRIVNSIALGVLFASALLSVACMLSHVYLRLEANNHDPAFIRPFVLGVLRMLGQQAWIDNGVLVFFTPAGERGISITLEKLGGHIFFNVLACGAITLIFLEGRMNLRKVLLIGCILFAYSVLRFVFLSFVYIGHPDMSIWWNGYVMLFTILPVGIVLGNVVPMRNSEEIAATKETSFDPRALWKPGIVSLFLAAACAGAYVLEFPGGRKQGRILVDEGHSHWEWTTERMSTDVYGVKTVYNYYCLKKLLGHFFSQVTSNRDRLTRHVLSDCDVLILKTPSEAYRDDEISAIKDFVAGGGGLWLIGDHTNVFGMCSRLNQIAKQFGIYFNPDAVTALPQGRQIWTPWEPFTHPIVQHMPPILLATSDSLCISGDTEAVMLGTNLFSDNPNYSVNTFFGDFECGGSERYGAFVQAAALRYGRGRVVAFTDSTIFSNFTMFMPGKPTLALCTVDWLNRVNGLPWLRRLCRALTVVLLALWLFALVGLTRSQALFALSCSAVLGLLVALAAHAFENRLFYGLPRQHTPFTSVAFERGHCSYHLPILSRTHEKTKNGFQTFYVWTQRLGVIPSVQHSVMQACNGSRVVVFIRPTKDFTPYEIGRLERYVDEGGGLLILDGPTNKQSTADQLLSAFGMSIFKPPRNVTPAKLMWKLGPVRDLQGQESLQIPNSRPVFHIKGGEGLLVSELGQQVISRRRHGKGLVVACTADHLFNNDFMGQTDAKPSHDRWVVWNMEFALFDMLLAGNGISHSNVRQDVAKSMLP